MSFLFGGGDTPTPASVPQSPSATDNEDAQRKRNEAEAAALADSKSRGRQQTVHAGKQIAEEEQAGKGLMSAKRRAASRDLVG